jgi:L-aminoadipate-semialdehyde dehydrogenase
VIELSTTFKPKHLSFVSSTSDIDTEFYVRLSDDLANKGQVGLSEDDDLEGSRTDLKTGYGQSKWVSEKLLMEAARRGLSVSIVRPGYVVGDAKSGGESFDFLLLRKRLKRLYARSHKLRRLHLAPGQRLHPTRFRA